MLLRLIPFLVLFVLQPAYVWAQLRGQVVDSQARPLSGATIELWTSLRRITAQETGASGAFSFPAAAMDSAVGIVVARAGYLPRSLTLATLAEEPQVVLSTAEAQLGELTITATPVFRCPAADDPEARALLQAASRRYSAIDTLHVGSFSERVDDELPASELGRIREDRIRRSGRQTGPQPRWVEAAHGYAFRLEASLSPEFAAWQYLDLGSHFAQHFAHASFAEHTTLGVQSRRADATVLVFCSRRLARQVPTLEGTLTITSDTTFSMATWRFRTPAPREDAGGEVTFVPHPGGAIRPWLVPSSSLFWRRVLGPGDRYYQLYQRFHEWVPAAQLDAERARKWFMGGNVSERPQGAPSGR